MGGWRDRKAKGAQIEEGDAWALNIEAYAYDSLGQPKKADAVFDELAKLDPDENPWVVNFVINRASRLVGQGRWKEGVKATLLARAVAEKYGSTYAKLILARQMACALPELGRADETASELAFLRDNAKDGIALSVAGLMCAGQNDEAAAMLLAALLCLDAFAAMQSQFGLALAMFAAYLLMRPGSDGVCTVPGQIALQRTPCVTKSAATALVMPITAALVVRAGPRMKARFPWSR